MATQRRGRAVFSPNLGLYLGRPPLLVPERGLIDCNNVRIDQGRIVHNNMGWSAFPKANLVGEVATSVELATNNLISGSAHDPVNERIYVCNTADDAVSVIDTATNSETAVINVGLTPRRIAYDSANQRMYVVNTDDDSVSVISTSTNSVTATISVGGEPRYIAYDSINGRMYVSNTSATSISVVDTSTNSVIATISLSDQPAGLAHDPVNGRVYVCNSGDDVVNVIDTATNSVVETVDIDGNALTIAYDTLNERMYAVSTVSADLVSVIDTSTNSVIATINVGGNSSAIAYDGINGRMYVTSIADDTVNIIDTSTNSVIAVISVGFSPNYITYDSVNRRMYVTTGTSLGLVDVINIGSPVNLDGKPVLLIDSFTPRGGTKQTIFGNTTDLFLYNSSALTITYLTPRVETGTVDVTNGSTTVTGAGTSWSTDLKGGDFIYIGATGQTSQTAPWYEIASVTSDTELELVDAYEQATAAGQAYTARSCFQGDIRTPFETERFFEAVDVQGTDGDRWYAANGVDPVVAWDGTADQVYRPDLGNVAAARFLKRFKNIMIYGAFTTDTGEDKLFSIRTSAIGQPENVVSAEAAEFIVHDGSDPLLTALPLGDQLVIYAERTVIAAQFVGGALVFIFRTAVSDFGPRSARAIAQFSDHHIFLAADAQYVYNGASARSINDHVWREVIRQTSPNRLDLLHTIFNEEHGELMWLVPLTTDSDPDAGQAETAFVLHYLEDVGDHNPMPHTKRDLPATAVGFYERESSLTWADISEQFEEFNYRWNDQFLQVAFPQLLFGDENGDIFILGETASAAGQGLRSFARFSRRPLANSPERKGVVRRIYPFIEHLPAAGYDLQVRLRTARTADGPSQQVLDAAFPVGTSETAHFVAARRSGRYAELEFGHETGAYWALTGYDLDVVDSSGR